MTGKLLCLLLLAACLMLSGCKKDAQIDAALAEVDSFTTQLLEIVNRAKTVQPPAPVIDEAQQYLDSRKREIKARAAYLASVRGIQVSARTERLMIETVRRNQLSVASLPTALMPVSNDALVRTKLDKLINDYLELFQA
jgi:hypothetical protein